MLVKMDNDSDVSQQNFGKTRQIACEPSLLPIKKSRKKLRRYRKRSKSKKLRIIAYVKQLESEKASRLVNVSSQTKNSFAMANENSMQQSYVPYALKEIEDFNHKHDVSYWKSLALSLQMENKMLLDHIKLMSSRRIQDWVDAQNEEEEGLEVDEVPYESPSTSQYVKYSKVSQKKQPPKKVIPPPARKSFDEHTEKTKTLR